MIITDFKVFGIKAKFEITEYQAGLAPVNQAPVLYDQNLSVEENQDLTVTLGSNNDIDGDPITYVITGSSDFTQNGNQITFNTAVVGQVVLNVTGSDGRGLSDTCTVTIDVTANAAPIVPDQALSVQESTDLVITLGSTTDPDGDAVSFTVTGSSDFTQNGNQITFNSASVGQQILTVTGTDSKGKAASGSVTIDVTAAPVANIAPVVADQNLSVQESTDLVITLGTVQDGDGDNVTYTVTGSSDFTQNGNQITFNSSTVGQQVLTVTGDDGTDSTQGTITIDVTAAPVNTAPVVGDQTVNAVTGSDLVITLGPIQDDDGDNVTYSVSGITDYSAGPGSNQITFNSASVGQQVATITGSDGSLQDTGTLTINVSNETNEAYPVILQTAEQFVAVDGTLDITPELSNPTSAGTVQWYKDFGHDDVQVDPETGRVTWDTTGLPGESFYVGLRCSNTSGTGRMVFIAHVGKVLADIVYVGAGETYTSWFAAYSNIKSGDTVIFRDGVYTSNTNRIGRDNDNSRDQYPVSGLSSKYTCVMAENPLGAEFSGGQAGVAFNLWSGGKNEANYITFKGFFAHSDSIISINGDPNDKLNTRPNSIKVINCGGVGEENIPIYARLVDKVLFENCFAYGGGRYKLSINEGSDCVMRRNLARYDRSDLGTDPKGSHIMYNTMNFRMDNCIAIDDLDGWMGSGYKAGAFGTPVTSTSVTPEGSDGIVERCLHLNSEQLLCQFDYQVNSGGGASVVDVRDMVSYDSKPHNIYIYSWGFTHFEKCTFSTVRPQHATDDSLIHNGGYNNFRGIVSCLWDNTDPLDTQYDFGSTNITVGNANVPYDGGTLRTVLKEGMKDINLTNSGAFALVKTGYGEQHISGTTNVSIDAEFNYVPRIDPTHSLADTHAGEVMFLKGKSGTLYGEAGYDQETAIPMWDFPFAYYMREKMAQYAYTGPTFSGSDYLSRTQGADATINGARGFCAAGEDLSSYVWGYKGNTVPPLGVQGVNQDGQATIRWELPASNHTGNITGYTVYDYDDTTHAMTNGRTVAAGTTEITINSLNNGFDYDFVVTATDSVKGESGFAYPVRVRPNGVPTQVPIIDTDPQSVSVIAGDQVTFTSSIQGAQSLQWTRDSVDIPGATGETYTFASVLGDDGSVYAIRATNGVGSVTSASATLTVTALDSTAPIISVAVNADTLNITLSDNIYANADISLQLIDNGVLVGSVFPGSQSAVDLTTAPIGVGNRSLQVRATDPQNNTADSNTVAYVAGTPLFQDDFTDASNWNGGITAASNEGTVTATTRGVADWWTNQTKMTLIFDMKILDQANDYEAYPRIRIGINTDGSKAGTLELFAYPNEYSNGWVSYVSRDGTTSTNLGTLTDFGNPTGFTAGAEEWFTYEVVVLGTDVTIKKNDVTIFTGTLPEDINPFSGTMQVDATASGDFMLRNILAYGDSGAPALPVDPTPTNNYITTNAVIDPVYGASMPAAMHYIIDPTTGTTVKRMTDSSVDMEQTSSAVNGYSRYSQENSNGTLYIAQGTNSTTSTIKNKATGDIVAYPAYDDSGLTTHTIGMAHEIRWDYTGNHPNRIYFRHGTSFYMIDDVTANNNVDRSNPTRTLIKDFEPLINWPVGADNGRRIYNDQEGDSSNDSDHWAWMAAYYDGSVYRCVAFIHYQISTDTTHILYPSDLAGTNLDMISGDPTFPFRPNMIEISPLGTGVVVHTGRAWGDGAVYQDTWIDGCHLWPLDFDFNTTEPLKIAISESHSGWAWAEDGRELFVYQDNRRDVFSATYLTGANKGYTARWDTVPGDDAGPGTIDFASHANMSWTNIHFGKMPPSKPGWIMMSTYGSGTEWAHDQLMMMQIKDKDQNPIIWRISPMYSQYEGAYFDEAPASMSLDGNSIYVSQNWGTAGGVNEVFRYDLPTDWLDAVNALDTTTYGTDITITGIEIL